MDAGTALPRPFLGLLALTIVASHLNLGCSIRLSAVTLAAFESVYNGGLNGVSLGVLVCRSFNGRRLISEFPMAYLAAGVGDVPAYRK